MSHAPVPAERDPGFAELVFSDLARYRAGRGSWLRVIAACAVEPGMIATLVLRAQQRLFARGWTRFAWMLRSIGVLLIGAEFIPGMRIGPGLWMPHPVGIVMGNDLTIGSGVTLGQGVTIGARNPNPGVPQRLPRIGDGAMLLARSTVVGDITVGAHSQVAANSLVVDDVPAYAVMLGVPAQQVGTRKPGGRAE